jgi:putative ABC transport system permease protein
MCYSLIALWHERQRFVPAILAVSFSALLIAVQSGMLLGIFSIVTIPVDHARAHIWVGSPDLVSIEASQPIPRRWASRLNMPQVDRFELYQRGFISWHKPTGGAEVCMLLGPQLQAGALGLMDEIGPQLRQRLQEPGTVAVDEAALRQLGLTKGVGEVAEANGQRIRVVGLVRGTKGVTAPYVLSSYETARQLLRSPSEQTGFVLAHCRDPRQATAVVAKLRRHHDMCAFTAEELSSLSRWHWLLKTGGGTAMAFTTLLGLLVGAAITSQSLYGATVASNREFAVLRAMGIPRWRIAGVVVAQSFWVGLLGLAVALPITYAAQSGGARLGVTILLEPWILIYASVVTLAMALSSGLVALRSLGVVEPAALLR